MKFALTLMLAIQACDRVAAASPPPTTAPAAATRATAKQAAMERFARAFVKAYGADRGEGRLYGLKSFRYTEDGQYVEVTFLTDALSKKETSHVVAFARRDGSWEPRKATASTAGGPPADVPADEFKVLARLAERVGDPPAPVTPPGAVPFAEFAHDFVQAYVAAADPAHVRHVDYFREQVSKPDGIDIGSVTFAVHEEDPEKSLVRDVAFMFKNGRWVAFAGDVDTMTSPMAPMTAAELAEMVRLAATLTGGKAPS